MMICRSKSHWKSNLKSRDIPAIPGRFTSAKVIKRLASTENRWMHEPEEVIPMEERKTTFWEEIIGPVCFVGMLLVLFLVWWYGG